jgi:MFS family permease
MRGPKRVKKRTAPTINLNRIVLCAGLAAFLFQFEAFFVHISLPDMQRELGASWNEVTRVVTIYLAGAILALIPAGFIGRSIGFGRTFILGSFVAALSVSVCGLVDTLHAVWALRLFQGIGIGFMVSSGYTLIPMWLPRDRWGWGYGVISQGAGLGMILGLPAGGLVAHFFQWRWIFLIQIPLLAGLALFSLLTVPRDPKAGWETKPQPSKDLWAFFFKVRSFRYALFSLLVFHGVLSGMRYLLPFFMESVQGMSSIQSSLVMVLYALGFVISARMAGRASDRIGSKGLLQMAYSLAFLGCIVFIGTQSTLTTAIILLLFGISTGLFSPSNNRLLMLEVPPEAIQTVSSVLPIALNLGVLSGIVAYQTLFEWIAGHKEIAVQLGPMTVESALLPYAVLYAASGGLCLALMMVHRQGATH